MSSEQESKKHPSHSVAFARIRGRDENNREILGPARQIGAIWPREGKDGDGILRLDHIPEELRSQGGGVLFVRKLDAVRKDRAADRDMDLDIDR